MFFFSVKQLRRQTRHWQTKETSARPGPLLPLRPQTRAPSGSPKKQRRPDWRGPLDKSESGSTVSGSNGTPKSQAHPEWKGPLEEEEDHNGKVFRLVCI